MFDDLDLEDEDEAFESELNKKAKQSDLAFEQESESGDFDANALLNFSDYQNKRQGSAAAEKKNPFEQ